MDLGKKRKSDENGVATVDADVISRFSPDDARRILEPFTREQLLEILQGAVIRHLDVLDSVRSTADRDITQRKLFIRGLGCDTTTEKLTNLFCPYGELEEAIVIHDKVTGKSKGFGFVTFKHVDGALLALKEPSKKIDGRMTVAQLAAQGNSGPAPNASLVDVSNRKIYVANVPSDMPADTLLAHFSLYGDVEEGPLGFDKLTGKSRGFALFVYKTAEAAAASLFEPTKTINGRHLVCKLASEGKKGKPGGSGVMFPGTVEGSAGGDRQTFAPGPLSTNYGDPVAPTGISSYGSFYGGIQGPHTMGHHFQGMNPSLSSSTGEASVGQAPPSYASGIGVSFPGSQYGAPIGTGFGGLISVGGAGSDLGNASVGSGGAGGIGLPGRLSASANAIPSSNPCPESGPYNLVSSGYSIQHQSSSGTSPAPKPGSMYMGVPSYY